MPSLKEIKTRIASVKNTLKITSAMKMVASAKLHKAQVAIGNNVPYTQQLHRILGGMIQDPDMMIAINEELGVSSNSPLVLQDVACDEIPLKKEGARVAVVAFSSNSSLCGSFNANVIRRFNEVLSELSDKGYLTEDVDVYAAGRKVAEAARKKGYEPVAELYDMVDKPGYAYASELSSDLVDKFISEEVSQVILIYSHFASMGSQPVMVENYLPFTLSKDPASEVPVDYILEPDPLSLVRSLLPKVLKLKIYTVMLDASAAEHAARTIAMQVASDNAQNLIAELTLVYNKTRQQAITAEILDIVGGCMTP